MIVELKNVKVIKSNKLIIDKLNFKLKKNEIISIVGSSGVGKTTLLRVIGGLEKEYSGEVILHKNSKCSIVFQEFDQLFPWKTVIKNIELPLKIDKNKNVKIDEAVKFLGLEGHEKKFPYQLSGGMKQRVSIGRSLVQNSNFILMDEPFGSLDINVRLELQDEILEIVKNGYKDGIIFITHDIEEALYISDKIFLMIKNFGYEIMNNEFKGKRNSLDLNFLKTKNQIMDKIK